MTGAPGEGDPSRHHDRREGWHPPIALTPAGTIHLRHPSRGAAKASLAFSPSCRAAGARARHLRVECGAMRCARTVWSIPVIGRSRSPSRHPVVPGRPRSNLLPTHESRRSWTPSTARPSADPYRWLEDQAAPETRAWLATQAAYADRLLPRDEQRRALEGRIAALMDRAEIGDAAARRRRRVLHAAPPRRGAGGDLPPAGAGRWHAGADHRHRSLRHRRRPRAAQPRRHDPGGADGGGSAGPLPSSTPSATADRTR